MLQETLRIIGDVGSPALLAVAIIMFFRGDILSKKTVDKMLAIKDLQYQTLERFYEDRLKERDVTHQEIRNDLRETVDKSQRTLDIAVHNNTMLIQQGDEMLELARTATPALIARSAVEAQNDRRTGSEAEH